MFTEPSKIRDIVIDILKEKCPTEKNPAVVDAFASLVHADIFAINDQEKKTAIAENTRIIKKVWSDEWSLWEKTKRLAMKVVSLGRTNKAKSDESETTAEVTPVVAAA